MPEILIPNHPQGCVEVIATEGTQQIGRVYSVNVRKTAELMDFHINREYRGRGIGTLLMDILEEYAARDGAERMVRIGFFCDSPSIREYIKTVRFLKKRGFRNRILLQSKMLNSG